jgi:hypothetical protein
VKPIAGKMRVQNALERRRRRLGIPPKQSENFAFTMFCATSEEGSARRI